MTTKEKIFLASAELFAERSYANVSMREIAEKVGIKAASIYNHYTAKEEILDDILRHYKTRIDRFILGQREHLALPDNRLTVEDIQFTYSMDEVQLMYWITRVVITEQFSYKLAKDILFGFSNERYTEGQTALLRQMYERGLIKNERNIPLYADMMARIAVSYQQDFAHNNDSAEVSDLNEMYIYFLELVLGYEGTLDRRAEILGDHPGINARPQKKPAPQQQPVSAPVPAPA